MSVYHTHDLGELADKIREKSKTADRAAANTINKSATFAIRESINEMTSDVNLKPSYIKKHLKTVARASYNNLRAVISANERGTLLARYPHVKTKDGYRVSVSRSGGFREIPNAVMVRTKNSNVMTIAMFNKDLVALMKKQSGKSNKTLKKMRRLMSKADYGRTPLHSSSINQMFEEVREDIQPALKEFMVETFYKDFKRLDK